MAERWHFEISPNLSSAPVICKYIFARKQDLGALGLWALCGSWISGAELGHRRGFMPGNLPDHLSPTERSVSALIEFGLWDFAQDDDGTLGYQMGYEGELWRMRPVRSFVPGGRWIEPTRRLSLYQRDGWKCQVCGSLDRLSLDHKLPRTRGGTDDDANLWTLCRSCNSKKGTRTVEEWLGVIL